MANPVSVNTTLPANTAPPVEPEKRIIKWRAGYTPVSQQPRTTAASQIRTATSTIPTSVAAPQQGADDFTSFFAQSQASSPSGPVLTERGNKVFRPDHRLHECDRCEALTPCVGRFLFGGHIRNSPISLPLSPAAPFGG